MKVSAQILTTPTADTQGTTLMLHYPSKRYLVGSLAEGTQRACIEMGTRLLKVTNIFLTGRTEWANTGGMIGMILTLADAVQASQAAMINEAVQKVRSKATRLGYIQDEAKMRELEAEAMEVPRNRLNIVGPPNLNYTLATGRRYIFRKGTPVNIQEVRDGRLASTTNDNNDPWAPTWADENVKVWSMSLVPAANPMRKAVGSISPRKRSFEEVDADVAPDGADINDLRKATQDISSEDRDYLEVKAVVGEMFDSSWRLDTLFETALSDVKLPATVFVKNAQTHKIEKYVGPLPAGEQELPDPDLPVLVRRPWPGALVQNLPPTKPAAEALSYIIKNHTQRGKFDPQRAKQHKVPPGQLFSKLTAGESVLNRDGETVTPDMVLGPSRIGGGFGVVDIPTVDYIDGIIGREEWRTEEVMVGVGAILWICGRGVAIDQRIHDFMRQFKHLEHIVSSPDYCTNNIALDSSATSTTKLRMIDPDRYRIPVHDSLSPDGAQLFGGTGDASTTRELLPLPEGVRIAARGDTLDLEPKVEYSTTHTLPALNIMDVESSVPESVLEEAAKSQQAAKTQDDAMAAWIESLPPDAKDVEIITLGTGSALPSKYRNVSATMIMVPGWGNVLLDCGENTVGQLRRVFDAAEFKQVLRDLKVVSISHMHADHHLGTAGVLRAWYEEVHGGRPAAFPSASDPDFVVDMEALFRDQHRLAVLAEPAFHTWMYEYSSVEDFGYSRIAPLIVPTIHKAAQEFRARSIRWHTLPEALEGLGENDRAARARRSCIPASLLGLADIRAAFVTHCHGARAISITWPSGFKVSYSGDCRPSENFAKIGKGSTVCIHEATFDDELLGDAMAKKHSTTSEALGIAEKMRAKACVLTHFSQRYQKIPIMERVPALDSHAAEEVSEEANVPEIAQDGSHEVTDDVTDENADAQDLINDAAPGDTYADQDTFNAGGGQQYALPKHSGSSLERESSKAGEAVKLRLKSDMKVCVAFDYMRVKVGDIGQLEKFTPALLALFEKEDQDSVPAEHGEPDVNGAEAIRANGNSKKTNAKKNKNGRRN